MVNSRAKGCRGELEFAKELGHYGIVAKRGQQHSGSPDSPDVIHDVPDVHFEVKWNEKLFVGSKIHQEAMEQAIEDAGDDKTPVLAFKRNRTRWQVSILWVAAIPNVESKDILVTMDLEDFMFSRMGFKRTAESVYVSPKKVARK